MAGPLIPILWSVIFFSIGGPLIDHETSTILNVIGWALVGIGLLSGKYGAISTLGLSSPAVYGLGFLAILGCGINERVPITGGAVNALLWIGALRLP